MEELGDGFSFVFVGCGVFGCCLTHVLGTWCCELIWTWFGRWFVGFCELEKPLNLFSTFQRFVNNWHFHHVHVWTICQQCRMPTNFNICNNVTWNDIEFSSRHFGCTPFSGTHRGMRATGCQCLAPNGCHTIFLRYTHCKTKETGARAPLGANVWYPMGVTPSFFGRTFFLGTHRCMRATGCQCLAPNGCFGIHTF